MSVIPFIPDGKNRTVVTIRDDYRKEGDAILIENFDASQYNDPKDSNTSYDLRIGSNYRDLREVSVVGFPTDRPLILHPGSAAIIETEEFVSLPNSRFGHIVPKVKLLHQGVSNTSSKIDPGYYGKLSITVFNLSKTPIELNKGDRFCTLYILDVASGVRPYQKPPKSIPQAPPRKTPQKISDFIEGYGNLITAAVGIATLVSIVISIVALYVTLTKDTPPRQETKNAASNQGNMGGPQKGTQLPSGTGEPQPSGR